MRFFLLLFIFLSNDACGKTFVATTPLALPTNTGLKQISSGLIYVKQKNKVLVSASFGYSDYLHKTIFTPTTQIYIGSLKKQFIAAAILKLMNEGKLSLNAPIGTYLSFNANLFAKDHTWTYVTTLHHLLTHVSGVFRSNTLDQSLSYIDNVYINSTSPESTLKFRYNSTAYYLLEMVIETVSHQSFSEYITQNFLVPFQMNDTLFHGPQIPQDVRQNLAPNLCYPYYFIADKMLIKSAYNPYKLRPFGRHEMISTVQDLCKWNNALYSGEIFNTTPTKAAELLLLMKGLYTTDEEDESHYGYGIETHVRNNKITYWHEGLVCGASVYLEYTPETDTHIVVVSNNDRASFNAKTGAYILEILIDSAE